MGKLRSVVREVGEILSAEIKQIETASRLKSQLPKSKYQRTQEQIASDLFDDVCREAGYDSRGVYNIINSLERSPELVNVRPDTDHSGGALFKNQLSLSISAYYHGSERFWEYSHNKLDQRVQEYFRVLGKTIGMQFSDASNPFNISPTALTGSHGQIQLGANALLQDGNKIEVGIIQVYKLKPGTK